MRMIFFTLLTMVAINLQSQPLTLSGQDPDKIISDFIDLKSHKWENRVVLMVSPSPEKPAYLEQMKILQDDEGIKDRDLVIYSLFPESGLAPSRGILNAKEVNALAQRYGFGLDEFLFILIGKDGTVKLRSSKVVSEKVLFSLIDSMPMRQAEMRE